MTGFTRNGEQSGCWLSVEELLHGELVKCRGQGVTLPLRAACSHGQLPWVPQVSRWRSDTESLPFGFSRICQEKQADALTAQPRGELQGVCWAPPRAPLDAGRWARGVGRWLPAGPSVSQRLGAPLWQHGNLGYRTKGNKDTCGPCGCPGSWRFLRPPALGLGGAPRSLAETRAQTQFRAVRGAW